ncbi:hypothetical protein SALWKB12_1976 [Snodgrassella communis]|nr:hypothetical protein SALWKB12_1976 [Snodgrassella communis]
MVSLAAGNVCHKKSYQHLQLVSITGCICFVIRIIGLN